MQLEVCLVRGQTKVRFFSPILRVRLTCINYYSILKFKFFIISMFIYLLKYEIAIMLEI